MLGYKEKVPGIASHSNRQRLGRGESVVPPCVWRDVHRMIDDSRRRIPDESRVETAAESWSRSGRQVEFAHLRLPTTDFLYHYRLVATIALAEISRQVGRRPTFKVPTGPRRPT